MNYPHDNHQHQHHCHLGGVVTSTLSRFDKLEMFFGKMLLMLKNISFTSTLTMYLNKWMSWNLLMLFWARISWDEPGISLDFLLIRMNCKKKGTETNILKTHAARIFSRYFYVKVKPPSVWSRVHLGRHASDVWWWVSPGTSKSITNYNHDKVDISAVF